ncbi:MAG: ATP-binding protein [Solirubrobacteraceae bacterium]
MSEDATATEHEIELPATAAAAGLARRELSVIPGIAGEVGYKALLLTTELIAVYVEDAEPDPSLKLRLAVSIGPQRVRVEVGGSPPGVAPETLLHTTVTPSLGGYGLRIVDRMADAWGVQDATATMIWFELAR